MEMPSAAGCLCQWDLIRGPIIKVPLAVDPATWMAVRPALCPAWYESDSNLSVRAATASGYFLLAEMEVSLLFENPVDSRSSCVFLYVLHVCVMTDQQNRSDI